MTVLVLGGTAEARALADVLDAENVDFVSSLAGRVSRPRLPAGTVRLGGFGGVDGLAAFLKEKGVSAVVDATHPFAVEISANAIEACSHSDVRLLRLARAGWTDLPGADLWHWVDGHDEAATTAAEIGTRILLTIGRQALDRFVGPLWSSEVVARVVDPVDEVLPPSWQVLLDRGPYSVEGELALMRKHRVDVLVTKDSGGDYTRAKLDASDALGVDVVIVRRPGSAAGGHCDFVSGVDAAVRWIRARR